MTGAVRMERQGAIAVLTIDNTAKRNAMTAPMWEQVPRHLAGVADDDAVHAVVLRGAGGHFCAGSAIHELDALHHSHLPEAAERAITTFPKPVIAAISGYCLGGGAQLAAACDIRVAGRDARFAVPPAKLGIVYPLTATRRLLALIGPSATTYLVMTGEQIDVARAHDIGLVDEICDDADARAREVAALVASRSQLTVQATKAIIGALLRGDDATELAARWVAEAHASPDLAAGLVSFAARRRARFTWGHPRSTGGRRPRCVGAATSPARTA